MQPYTPHGDSNVYADKSLGTQMMMQPYTPHGDSNKTSVTLQAVASGCNLIPLTGTVTFCSAR